MKTQSITALLICTLCTTTYAEKWVDKHHQNIKSQLHNWSNDINDWLGETDPNRPASATLRLIFDNEWNRYNGYSIKPRIRGKIKLPVLKKHLSLVFGDDNLDNESRDNNRLNKNYPTHPNTTYHRQQNRHQNSSLALRWSEGFKNTGIHTHIDLGVRSGSDIYLRFRAEKNWQWTERFNTELEQIYRYGTNSKHYLRTNLEHRYAENEQTFFANSTHLQYTHDIDEETGWANSTYRQHNLANYKQLNYGFSIGGNIKHKHPSINQYGPFINWRQPIWREWLFIQPEAHFYNNKKENRKHHLGAFLRIEAIF